MRVPNDHINKFNYMKRSEFMVKCVVVLLLAAGLVAGIFSYQKQSFSDSIPKKVVVNYR